MWLHLWRWIPQGGVGFTGGWCTPLEVVQAGEVVWCVLGLGGGISEDVYGLHVPKRSLSLAMASGWLWCTVDGVSWMVQESKFRAWTMWSSGVSVGWIT